MPFDPNAAALPDSGVFGLPFSPDDSKVVLLPVPFEATTSYGGGTADGPRAILEASRQVDLFDLETGKPYEAGIAMLDEPAEVRAWSDEGKALARPVTAHDSADAEARALERVNALSEKMNAWVYGTTKAWLSRRKIVGVIGGDHSTPFGAIRAYAEAYPRLGVLHLDAHADLRSAYEGFTYSHASIMFNVLEQLPGVTKLVQVGIRDFGEAEHDLIVGSDGRVHTFFDARLARARLDGVPWREQVDQIVQELPQHVYLSWDIDGLDPVLCPNTGTPVPGGLSFHQATALLEGVVRAGKTIVGFDLNEVAPGPEGDEWDGNVAARLLYKMIGWTLKSQ
ncbi:MAG: agmatinase family protein [Myxococcaceae bacterium]|nr:agmatinase family protein [Myxococcaceae bacterium]MCA3013759.1 agmatinase family protein [Myxococcaceae bacterium]